jgi:hypothetical protein
MKPELKSKRLLADTRSKAKMLEYSVRSAEEFRPTSNPARLFVQTIGVLGEFASYINKGDISKERVDEQRKHLLFSANFFDAFLESRLDGQSDSLLKLLGAASYYLGELPGCADVILKKIDRPCPDLDGDGLEHFLCELMIGKFAEFRSRPQTYYSRLLQQLSQELSEYFDEGTDTEPIYDLLKQIADIAYKRGSPIQLLLSDTIAAIIRLKLVNSAWNAIPHFSRLDKNQWRAAITKRTFIKELWPSQIQIGAEGIYAGASAVIQMPTSAGKTKSIELIIRSAFLANRTKLAIVVAPYRALCHEIKSTLVAAFRRENVNIDEYTDVMSMDINIDNLMETNQIIVSTPEKLNYVLKQMPELASNARLVVFDEGHQFDNGDRGITYELLVTVLRSLLPSECQLILISAVIINAESLAEWLIGPESKIVKGTKLHPTFRLVGFMSWANSEAKMTFISKDPPNEDEFSVPGVIQQLRVLTEDNERIDFPQKSKENDISLYLGFRLIKNGSVAIFCGRKDTASNLARRAASLFEYDFPYPAPSEVSNQDELNKLTFLCKKNLGAASAITKCASLGIFSHHRNVPHGIRIAVEHSMRNNLARFVICTSTLAQGVNLPLKYLIVSNVYQGTSIIKVRDFHNLIGRAGRAGMHTEGSILFADPQIYDTRRTPSGQWRWSQMRKLLEPNNSEPCLSSLLTLTNPIQNERKNRNVAFDLPAFLERYISEDRLVNNFTEEIVLANEIKGFKKNHVEKQVQERVNILASVESFLLANCEFHTDSFQDDLQRLAESTLAYFLEKEDQRDWIVNLFRVLGLNIASKTQSKEQCRKYGRTSYGYRDAVKIETWVTSNIYTLQACENEVDLFRLLWPIISEFINSASFAKCENKEILKEASLGWISGENFENLHSNFLEGTVILRGSRRYKITLEHVVDIFEGGLSFEGTLTLGSVITFLQSLESEELLPTIQKLETLQKMIRYGLPHLTAISCYELGFADRVVSMEISSIITASNLSKESIKLLMFGNQTNMEDMIKQFPSIFMERFHEILNL